MLKRRGKTCLALKEALCILPRKLSGAAHPTTMPAGRGVCRGEQGRSCENQRDTAEVQKPRCAWRFPCGPGSAPGRDLGGGRGSRLGFCCCFSSCVESYFWVSVSSDSVFRTKLVVFRPSCGKLQNSRKEL